MKKRFYFFGIMAISAFASCTKEHPANADNIASIQYDFTTDKAGNFDAKYSVDSSTVNEPVTSYTWSKTVVINMQNSESHTVSFTILPPFEWTNTTDRANVFIKISVNGVEKSSNTGMMGGIDHPAGLTAIANF